MPTRYSLTFGALVAGLAIAAGGCTSQTGGGAPASQAAPGTAEAPEAPLPEAVSPYASIPSDVQGIINQPFTGDLDAMVKRRLIRAGVVFNRTHYFIDHGQQRGLAYESLTKFEDDLNAELKTGVLKVHVAFVPLSRELLLPALAEGKVDMVAAMLTVTPERQALVDFTEPTRTKISEVVVVGPGVPPVATPEDLSGREVFVRGSSSYNASLISLNERLKAVGRPPVVIKPAPEVLEDDDILEMVNAGLVSLTVVDSYMAEFWSQVFPKIAVQPATVRSDANLAVAIRKNSPKLQETANRFVRKNQEGSLFRNVLERRYMQSAKYVKDAASEAERKKYLAIVNLFKKYGDQYDLDYLLMAAQGYQESTLDQAVKSPVGAIGVMQVMPATGKELNVGDIALLEPNIHAGVKYMRFMIDRYYANEPMDRLNKGLMTFASYNAGPGRVRQLRNEAAKRGLDPNVWFGNVERVASERIGRETVQYVSNIYKYYIAYRLYEEQQELRNRAKEQAGAR